MPFEQELKQFKFLHGYGQMLLVDINADNGYKLVCDGGVNPAWILGHLALVANMGLELTGGTPKIDIEAWKPMFDSGTIPKADVSAYPAWDELIAAWNQAHGEVAEAIAQADADAIAQPNPIDALREALPTIADLIRFMLTGHEAMHLGQLSTWRRVQGWPPLF